MNFWLLWKLLVMYSRPHVRWASILLFAHLQANVCHRERHLHLLQTGNISLLQVHDRVNPRHLKHERNQWPTARKDAKHLTIECLTVHWRTHKDDCRTLGAPPKATALRVGSTAQLAQLVEISKYNTLLYAASPWVGPSLGSGKGCIGLFLASRGIQKRSLGSNGRRARLKVSGIFEKEVGTCNVGRSGSIWVMKLTVSLSTDSNWIDVVLDAILNRRLPTNNTDAVEESQRYSVILASLFPHLVHFTPAQNSALLDIILDKHWSPEGAVLPVWTMPGAIQFRLKEGTTLLFGHGKPSENLLVQLVGRCMGWSVRPYDELFTLFEYVAFPIQQHWPDIAGTRILDTIALIYLMSAGKPVPYDKVFQLAATSPMACKHLLPVVISLRGCAWASHSVRPLWCDIRQEEDGEGSHILDRHLRAIREVKISERLKTILSSDGGPFKIEVAEWGPEELKQLMLEALKRLDNPPFPPSDAWSLTGILLQLCSYFLTFVAYFGTTSPK
ncbi:hypothetical protein K438DRAFT_1772276 [Mycena galopus ATCC 62051]|nr:hypothetical protein K438DRAFT_1772276 [Mycena galopus ATCC 62051]